MNKNYKRPLIIDGAMGTELMNLGVDIPLPLWSSIANFDEYDKVVDIHERYINAGSDIITSNTFRSLKILTTPRCPFLLTFSGSIMFK